MENGAKGDLKGSLMHLRRNNPMDQYRLRTDLLESSFSERNLGVLVDKLNMSQHCIPVSKVANSFLNCIKQRVASQSGEGFSYLLSPARNTAAQDSPV